MKLSDKTVFSILYCSFKYNVKIPTHKIDFTSLYKFLTLYLLDFLLLKSFEKYGLPDFKDCKHFTE